MAMEVVGGAVLGAVLGELLKAVIDAKQKASSFQPSLVRLESTLKSIIPRLDQISRLNYQLNHPEMEELVALINNGKILVVKCSKISTINLVRKVKYSKELLDLDNSLLRYFITILPLDHFKDTKEILVLVKKLVGDHNQSESAAAGTSSRTGLNLEEKEEIDKAVVKGEEDLGDDDSSQGPNSIGIGVSVNNSKGVVSGSGKGSNLGSSNSPTTNGTIAQNSSSTNRLNNGKKTAAVAGEVGTVLGSAPYEVLPSFQDVQKSKKKKLFIRKLNLCCVVFDFNDPAKNLKEKDIKRRTLLELVDYISSVEAKFNEVEMPEITKMVAANLFRAFPSSNHDNKVLEMYDPEEDEPAMEPALEPAWPHLQIVYEILFKYVCSPETDAKLAKRYIDHSFVLRLLDLFDSEDPREREYLKTILHRIYGKFMVHRPFIRKAINNIFFGFIFETEKHCGIAELLEILRSVINGFALPLKKEHKLFLVRALIPLHKPKCVSLYHKQLSYCITQFVEKDIKLADTVIRGLLKYWPVTNSSKEVMFLGELEEVLKATHAAEFQRCMVPLFRQIGRCLNSSHFQVAERALFLWNNDHITNLIDQNCKVILPIIFPALERSTRGHWNKAVQGLSLNVRKIFSDANQALLNECLVRFEEDEVKQRQAQEKRESIWKRLEDMAASKDSSNEAVLVSRFVTCVAISSGTNQRSAASS